VGGGELLRDLLPRVAGPDHDDRSGGNLTGTSIRGAVQLDHVVGELGSQAGDSGRLERAGGDHDLACPEAAVAGVDHEPARHLLDPVDRTTQSDRQRELRCVVAEVVRDHVLGRVLVGSPWKRQARQRVVLRGSEEPQRVPTRSPRLADLPPGVEDQETSALPLEVVGDRESRLSAADDDDVEGLSEIGGRHPVSFDWWGAGDTGLDQDASTVNGTVTTAPLASRN
jgi:hypothetical protein